MKKDLLGLSTKIMVNSIVKIRTKGISKDNFKIIEINNEDNGIILLRLEPYEEIINVSLNDIVLTSDGEEKNKNN